MCRDEDHFKPGMGTNVKFSPGRDVRVDLIPFAGEGRQFSLLSLSKEYIPEYPDVLDLTLP